MDESLTSLSQKHMPNKTWEPTHRSHEVHLWYRMKLQTKISLSVSRRAAEIILGTYHLVAQQATTEVSSCRWTSISSDQVDKRHLIITYHC